MGGGNTNVVPLQSGIPKSNGTATSPLPYMGPHIASLLAWGTLAPLHR